VSAIRRGTPGTLGLSNASSSRGGRASIRVQDATSRRNSLLERGTAPTVGAPLPDVRRRRSPRRSSPWRASSMRRSSTRGGPRRATSRAPHRGGAWAAAPHYAVKGAASNPRCCLTANPSLSSPPRGRGLCRHPFCPVFAMVTMVQRVPRGVFAPLLMRHTVRCRNTGCGERRSHARSVSPRSGIIKRAPGLSQGTRRVSSRLYTWRPAFTCPSRGGVTRFGASRHRASSENNPSRRRAGAA
jgi:hypothetical protein